jgi:hypothetical protein
MIDIVNVDGDIGLFDTQTAKAANILSIQTGSLAYAPDLGIDLRYFIDEDFRFENESFKAYLVQVLAENSINVASVLDTVEALFTKFTFNLTPSETEGTLIAR